MVYDIRPVLRASEQYQKKHHLEDQLIERADVMDESEHQPIEPADGIEHQPSEPADVIEHQPIEPTDVMGVSEQIQ